MKCVHKECISSSGWCWSNLSQETIDIKPDVKEQFLSFNWFAGTIERDLAEKQLMNRKFGTYLLRVSRSQMQISYVISLK